MSVHYGDDQVAAVAAQQGPGMLFAMSSPAVAEVATVLFMTSLFAAMISFHNAVARYMFALGRGRVLPATLGRTEPCTGAPRIASLTQSAVGLAVIVLYALAGWDPMVRLFWLGTTGAFGVLCLLAVTSIAVVRFFARDPHGESPWRRLVAPTLADLAGLVGEVVAVERAPIVHETREGGGSLRIDEVVSAEMEPFRGPDGTITTLRDSLFSTVPGSPACVARAHHHRVDLPEHGMVWSFEGRNAIQSDYRITYTARP